MIRNTRSLQIVLMLILTTYVSNVSAYLDPGTGSYLLQLLAAAFLGGAYTVGLYWTRLKYFVKNLFSKNKVVGEDEED